MAIDRTAGHAGWGTNPIELTGQPGQAHPYDSGASSLLLLPPCAGTPGVALLAAGPRVSLGCMPSATTSRLV
jgi:hypothetical protein